MLERNKLSRSISWRCPQELRELTFFFSRADSIVDSESDMARASRRDLAVALRAEFVNVDYCRKTTVPYYRCSGTPCARADAVQAGSSFRLVHLAAVPPTPGRHRRL